MLQTETRVFTTAKPKPCCCGGYSGSFSTSTEEFTYSENIEKYDALKLCLTDTSILWSVIFVQKQ